MDRKKQYKEVTGGRATHLKIEVYYLKGGMNYFTCADERRGIYISVSPVSRTTQTYGTSESYIAFTGTKIFVKEMKRYNQKAFDEYQVDEKLMENLIKLVLEKNGLELKKADE